MEEDIDILLGNYHSVPLQVHIMFYLVLVIKLETTEFALTLINDYRDWLKNVWAKECLTQRNNSKSSN